MISFVILHPGLNPAALGAIPAFFDAADPRPAREQIDANYVFGGWMPLHGCKAVKDHPFAFAYPGDPVFEPIAIAMVRDEIICLYKADFVGIWQKDGSFEISRCD